MDNGWSRQQLSLQTKGKTASGMNDMFGNIIYKCNR